MNINHIALWCIDIEALREFYCRWFGAQAGPMYHNPRKSFTSYFLTLPDGECRLELMNVPGVVSHEGTGDYRGFCHIAVSAGSREKVDEMTERMRSAGVTVLGEPRTTGDGYYESVVADPEGNRIELTV